MTGRENCVRWISPSIFFPEKEGGDAVIWVCVLFWKNMVLLNTHISLFREKGMGALILGLWAYLEEYGTYEYSRSFSETRGGVAVILGVWAYSEEYGTHEYSHVLSWWQFCSRHDRQRNTWSHRARRPGRTCHAYNGSRRYTMRSDS